MNVEKIPINLLSEDPQNARRHPEENMKAIKNSLQNFNQVEPLVIQKSRMRVIGGNGRLKAMKELGWAEAECVLLDLPDSKARALGLALNRTAELAEWDFSQLADTLQEIDTGEFDVSALTGFDERELERIASWAPKDDRDETEAVPEPPAEAASKMGDLWELGRHRLLCGDSTKAEDVARLMDGKRASLMNTDPPYGVAYDSNQSKPDGHRRACPWEMIENDDHVGAEIQPFLEAAFRVAKEIALLPNAAWYLWHAHLTGAFFAAAAAAAAADVLLHRQIIWTKPHFILGRGTYHWRHEPCFMGWIRGNRPPFYGLKNQSTVWEIDYNGKKINSGTEHPTQKPIRLFEIPIENHTQPGEVCYEPFSGSGSQVIAAEKLGRRCYAIEISPPFVDVAVMRFINFNHKDEIKCSRHEAVEAIRERIK